MKNVVLVSMDWRRPQDGKTSLGIASIAAALKKVGVNVMLIDETVNASGFSQDAVLKRVVRAIEDAGPECLVGFGVYVWNDNEVRCLLKRLKLIHKAGIVLGGPQISYMHRGGLETEYPEADIFVRGQGESAMIQLALGENIEGCGVHIAGTPDQGLKADQDLSILPSPYLEKTIALAPKIRWETQRGCPFKCFFCQHREPGNRLRNQWFDNDRLNQELALFAQSGVKRISILDPIFHANPDHAIKQLEAMRRLNLKAQVSLQCRFEMVTPAFLDALDGLDVTLEFGLQTIIPKEYKAIGRPNNLRKVEQVIHELHTLELDFEVSLIYGLPHQTLDSFKKSLEWCEHHAIPRKRAWPLMLLRGTQLYEQKQLYGFKESTDQRIPIVIASNSFTEDEYLAMAELADNQGDNDEQVYSVGRP